MLSYMCWDQTLQFELFSFCNAFLLFVQKHVAALMKYNRSTSFLEVLSVSCISISLVKSFSSRRIIVGWGKSDFNLKIFTLTGASDG